MTLNTDVSSPLVVKYLYILDVYIVLLYMIITFQYIYFTNSFKLGNTEIYVQISVK